MLIKKIPPNVTNCVKEKFDVRAICQAIRVGIEKTGKRIKIRTPQTQFLINGFSIAFLCDAKTILLRYANRTYKTINTFQNSVLAANHKRILRTFFFWQAITVFIVIDCFINAIQLSIGRLRDKRLPNALFTYG